ncbi:MAG: hypothetical protein KDK08_15030 [Rhizobiaceae bacterium]|nr:hypothetical protein [Rhizobiaceae bacterium]
MTSTNDGVVWTYEHFQPGETFGSVELELDETRLALWKEVYGDDSRIDQTGQVPRGLLVAGMMETYLRVVSPRPPGNIHASQKLMLGSGSLKVGDTVTATVTCLDKVRRKDRGWVTIGVVMNSNDQEFLRGEIRTVWAR